MEEKSVNAGEDANHKGTAEEGPHHDRPSRTGWKNRVPGLSRFDVGRRAPLERTLPKRGGGLESRVSRQRPKPSLGLVRSFSRAGQAPLTQSLQDLLR